MTYFIFRNQTIEPFFPNKDYLFSGYGDISQIPTDVDGYIWFYQLPLISDIDSLVKDVDGFGEKLQFVVNRLPKEKMFIGFTVLKILDLHVEEGDKRLDNAISDYNQLLISLASNNNNIKAFDIYEFTSLYKSSELIDWKFWFLSQMSLSPKLYKPFMAWWNGKMRGIEMKRKKCLVLDLDNTLWGGILGEDGIEGIKLGGDYPGKAFLWWQQSLKALGKSGVILTVCSKNNEEDVVEAWNNHPDMVLTDKSFSSWRINWHDKATNIREIAGELNIGLDSLVFIDDNPTERELVKQMLPMVEVPEFPNHPYLLPQLYKQLIDDYFQVYAITAEDKNKTAQYKANANRAKARNSFSNFDEYLRSLEITINILEINDFNLPRIVQMTQKTNQFNLTTHRYIESDIRKFADDGWHIWCISVEDKFGDSGITGCIMIDNNFNIDTFLLSCRILGKGIEKVFMQAIINKLGQEGVDRLTALYIPSAKNSQVKHFYEDMGFELDGQDNGIKRYSINLRNTFFPIVDYYTINFK